jgi:hypothetical protein
MDAAWAQCLAESSGEALLRGVGCAAPGGDAFARAWGDSCARAFGRAWAHADAMSVAALRDEYAAVLTAADGALARRGLDALAVDLAAVLAVARARGGREAFADRVKAVEGALAGDARGGRGWRRSSFAPVFHSRAAPLRPFAGVLVACMGHYSARMRGAAVRMLNALYDGTDWQLAQVRARPCARRRGVSCVRGVLSRPFPPPPPRRRCPHASRWWARTFACRR